MNPPGAEFCAECGILLSSAEASSFNRTRQTQFALPDYLLAAREREREDRRRRLAMESGEGVGLLWIGAIAAVLALWFGSANGIGAPVFTLGLAAILIGLWRLRHDDRNMARVGMATIIVSSMVLGAALAQTLGFGGSPLPAPRLALTRPTPTPDPAEAAISTPSDDVEVPMFRGNAARTGENPGPAPMHRPLVTWKTFVGGETYASPVIGLDAVFVATKAGSLVALRLTDGKELWRADVGDYIARSTPALDGDVLYVSAGYALMAIDAKTGKERWSVPLRFAGSCSPVVDADRVYVATQEGHVSAFAKANGSELWHYRNDNLLFGSPAVASGVVVIADEVGAVTAIDARTGRELWQDDAGAEVFATAAIADGTVYVATTKPSLLALDVRTGKERWQRGVGGGSSPAVADGTVYLGGDDQALRALDAKTGDTRWSSPLGYAIESSATLAGDAVFVGSGPTLNAIDRRDGHTLWTQVTGGDVTSDLAIAGNRVIATSHDGYVYALAPPAVAGQSRSDSAIGGKGVSLGASR